MVAPTGVVVRVRRVPRGGARPRRALPLARHRRRRARRARRLLPDGASAARVIERVWPTPPAMREAMQRLVIPAAGARPLASICWRSRSRRRSREELLFRGVVLAARSGRSWRHRRDRRQPRSRSASFTPRSIASCRRPCSGSCSAACASASGSLVPGARVPLRQQRRRHRRLLGYDAPRPSRAPALARRCRRRAGAVARARRPPVRSRRDRSAVRRLVASPLALARARAARRHARSRPAPRRPVPLRDRPSALRRRRVPALQRPPPRARRQSPRRHRRRQRRAHVSPPRRSSTSGSASARSCSAPCCSCPACGLLGYGVAKAQDGSNRRRRHPRRHRRRRHRRRRHPLSSRQPRARARHRPSTTRLARRVVALNIRGRSVGDNTDCATSAHLLG